LRGAPLQKAECEYHKAHLVKERESLEQRKQIDRVCGLRWKWTVCDTPCAARELQDYEQETAKACDPALIQKLRQEDEREADLQANGNAYIEACSSAVTGSLSDVANPDWTKWRLPNCSNIWLQLEDRGLRTKGLSCPPTDAERAEYHKPPTIEQQQQDACSYIAWSPAFRVELTR
jgi:hypothetical protein